jgi:hypothetical protein
LKDRRRLFVFAQVTSKHSFDRREPEQPTRTGALWFAFRAKCFQVRRLLQNLSASAPRKLTPQVIDESGDLVAESRIPLYKSVNPAEFALQAGKVQNLRLAVRSIHGVRVRAGEDFSFWAQVGRPTRRRGFVTGRELREGCIIPSIGGGLCQLTNALYDAALTAGLEIVERHAHSQRIPGSMAVTDRDATVFWNYVDLRLRAVFDWQIEARLNASELLVSFRRLSAGVLTDSFCGAQSVEFLASGDEVESCETCGVTSCFRNSSAANLSRSGVTAWLLDAWQPEHDQYLLELRQNSDYLFTPLDSARRGVGPYRWNSKGFARVIEAPLFVLERSVRSRRLAAQGAARQRALLALDEKLERIYARRLPPEATHLIVSQNLLPFLWRDGVLGGRTFDVLMTRLPMAKLEAVLDRAASAHPESRTLADFRAPREIVAAESDALAQAASWITPHRYIARFAGDRAKVLEWERPKRSAPTGGDWVVYPASTLGRKGACELREAMRGLNLPIRLCGPVIEDPDFWRGFKTERHVSGDWLTGAHCVVLPAWVENQPRRVLEAVAAGVPVIVSEACGLDGLDGVLTVPTGDADALREAIEGVLVSA